MRSVRGFICVGCEGQNQVLFGESRHVAGQSFESMETNGITPFPHAVAAARAAVELREWSWPLVAVRTIWMQIAETEQDLAKLHRSRGLIVLMYGEGVTSFWGRSFPGRSTTLYALLLITNGLQPFPNFVAAERCAQEVRRQGLSQATVAAFHLNTPRRLKKNTKEPVTS